MAVVDVVGVVGVVVVQAPKAEPGTTVLSNGLDTLHAPTTSAKAQTLT
tara:strand:- start:521 stop:664 length:144 start_codon:yes stop_codon:yes gene_type:complete